MNNERRRDERFPDKWSTLKCLINNKEVSGILDISSSGIAVILQNDENYYIGDRLSLQISSQSNEVSAFVNGKVIRVFTSRSNNTGIGIEFTNRHDKSVDAVISFLNYHNGQKE